MIELPEPIRRYFDGSNAHDPDACAACFADDAIVRDERQEHRGVGAVREWMRDAITRYGNFPGSPIVLRHSFVVAGGKIARLEIVP
jgi:ketosteroid isomerase-like protein